MYKAGFGSTITEIEVRDGYDYPDLREKVGELAWAAFEESLELVQMANE
jgi:peptide chain release factor 3